MANDDINNLRSQIQRLRKAATRKVSRLKTAKDVYVSGTNVDPRRKPHVEEKYNARQLRKYAEQLQGFMSRGTQYVPDSQRRPMPAQDWREYKKLEKQYNQKVHDYFKRVEQIQLPNSEENIGQRMAKMTPDHRQMGNVSVNAPYKPPERPSTAVAGRAALEKLKADMERRLTPEYFDEVNKAGMEQFSAMAEIINEPQLADDVRGLTGEQFAVLWNYTAFPTAVSLNYEIMLKLLSGKEQAHHSDAYRQQISIANELIEWAKTLKVGM